MKDPKKKDQPQPEERRKYIRIKKNFIMTYFLKDQPAVKHEASQLKNISKGGLCFITAQKYEPQMRVIVEIRTPYIADITRLEGKVLESHEKLKDIIYETRLQFENLTPQNEILLNKLEEFFIKEKGADHNP